MYCCSNPDIKSSTYSDWCENCGWAFSYLTNEESTYGDLDTKSFAQVVAENNDYD